MVAYRVVKGTGLLSGKADQEGALSTIIVDVREHNTFPQRWSERTGEEFKAKWDTWVVPGKWWVAEEQEKGRKGNLYFTPAREGRPVGIRVIGTITIEEVGEVGPRILCTDFRWDCEHPACSQNPAALGFRNQSASVKDAHAHNRLFHEGKLIVLSVLGRGEPSNPAKLAA